MTTAARTATPLDPSSTRRVDDTRMKAIRPLITPALLQEWLPAPDTTTQLVEDSRAAVCRILSGQDDRLLVVVGPCSIHDHAQAMEYARQLKAQADALSDDLLILMRVYFEKPRTTVGWKGYINDPHMDDSYAINQGLEMARRLLLDVLQLGMPVATEFLDLLSPQFISELISWGAIGARTTESQSHRQLASGLSCPVGFKNGTDGGVKVAADAILAAQASHAFMGITKMGLAAIFETHGHPYCHIILRGGKVPNYSAARTGDDRLLARQQQQAAPPPDRRGPGRGRSDRLGRCPHHRRDDREPPERRSPGHPAWPATAIRRFRDRRLPEHGTDHSRAADTGAGGAQAASDTGTVKRFRPFQPRQGRAGATQPLQRRKAPETSCTTACSTALPGSTPYHEAT